MIRVDNTGSSNALIQVRGVNKTYRRGGENIQVLQGLNLDVDKGDFVAFMGPSGSGKTTCAEFARRAGCARLGPHFRGWRRDHEHVGQQPTQWRARHVDSFFRCTT